jgi:hypothetical protein
LYLAPVSDGRVPQKDTVRQALLLAPGTAMVTTGLISLFHQASALGWLVFAVGLVLLLAFVRSKLRSRGR